VDQRSLELVARLLEDRVSAIRRAKPAAEGGRGQQLVELVDALLEGTERERDRILADLAGAAGDEMTVLGRKLLRLLTQVRGLSMLTPYLEDVGRNDLPMGLVQAVDKLIDALLPNGADPLVHLDEHHNYSTLDLISLTRPVAASLGVTNVPVPGPVVFFLPSTDPSNALLLPILAHEVGHAAVDQANLGSEVLRRADRKALDDLLNQCLTAAGATDPTPWKINLFRWLEEVICDALAVILTGPSFLFAAAVFLPAPDEGVVGTHPFPGDRVQMTLRLLEARGWRPLMDSHSPNITSWLEAIDQPIDTSDPRERFLREGIRILEPAVVDVADQHVSGSLDPKAFESIQSFLAELLHAGIPPAEIGGKPIDPWATVLGGWLHGIRERGDEPVTLATTGTDSEFNASILKAIEMARILDLWRKA
jgi:hypothetical protein